VHSSDSDGKPLRRRRGKGGGPRGVGRSMVERNQPAAPGGGASSHEQRRRRGSRTVASNRQRRNDGRKGAGVVAVNQALSSCKDVELYGARQLNTEQLHKIITASHRI